MPLEWQKLRAFNGSQQEAFEEICCQLFAQEHKPAGSRFERKGKPDSGIEACWILPTGVEEGLQCKYVLSLTDSLLQQLDASVLRALDGRPSIIKYTICLPFDLPDGRTQKGKSARQKYDTRVLKWTKWAEERSMLVEFVLWGSSELLSPQRLLKGFNAGMIRYWFDELFLSNEWLHKRFEESKADVARRYQPDKHLVTEIEYAFSGLLFTNEFISNIQTLINHTIHEWKNLNLDHVDVSIELKTSLFDSWQASNPLLFDVFQRIDKLNSVPIEGMLELLAKIEEARYEIMVKITESFREAESFDRKSGSSSNNEARHNLYRIDSDRRHLQEFGIALNSLVTALEAPSAFLAAYPNLLIKGEGGIGKTHLLCRMVETQIENGLPAVLLLGGKFHIGGLLRQIREQLDLGSCGDEEFLGALETAAIATGTRALLAIDAINESHDPASWRLGLLSALTCIKRFPHIAITISIRTGTEPFFLPDKYETDTKILYHPGFALESDADIGDYIEGFGLQTPTIPMLRPEFNNPLFLQLICDTLQRRGEKRFPQGHVGLMTVLSAYLDEINKEYTARSGFDPSRRFIQNAMDALAEQMAISGINAISRNMATEIVSSMDPAGPHAMFKDSLFGSLIHSGIIRSTVYWSEEEKSSIEGISFMFERFADHLIATALLKPFYTTEKLIMATKDDERFEKLWHSKWWYGGGNPLAAALSIQVPERYEGIELLDYYPEESIPDEFIESFLESLVWRESTAFYRNTYEWIERIFSSSEYWRDTIFEMLLSVALRPEHPLNADKLFQFLMKQPMPQRDSVWSTFLHRNWSDNDGQSLRPVRRLIEWCLEGNADRRGPDSLLLYGRVLGWMLTTSSRIVRDRATKALVAIFTDHIEVLHELLFSEIEVKFKSKPRKLSFLDIDDPYVTERLLAAAYGVAVRSIQKDGLRELAQSVYDRYFSDRNPPTHILLRDYARGIVEFALHLKCEIEVDATHLEPPYRSEWPSVPPSEEELKRLYGFKSDEKSNPNRPWAIHSSVMSDDFGVYTIGAGYQKEPLGNWLDTPLNEQPPLLKSERENLFEESLTPFQVRRLNRYNRFTSSIRGLPFRISGLKNETDEEKQKSELCFNQQESLLISFLESLSESQLAEYQAIQEMDFGREGFSGEYALRWVCHRAYQLGWNAELHGKFDANVNYGRYNRTEHTSERIGKKYQWIAWHEFQALLSDHYFSARDGIPAVLRGAWQIGEGDIDPSLLFKGEEDKRAEAWWKPICFVGWRRDDPLWFRETADLPDPKLMVEVIHPKTGASWLVLRIVQDWDEPQLDPTDTYRNKHPYAQLWYQMQSFLIPVQETRNFKYWAKRRLFHGPLMPHIPDLQNCYFGEFHWAESYFALNPDAVIKPNKSPVRLRIFQHTINHQSLQSGFDYSNNGGSVRVSLPSKALVDLMCLRRTANEGEWADQNGDAALYDPLIRGEGGQTTILVRKDTLLAALSRVEMTIVWTLMGEKRFMSMGDKWPEGVHVLDIGGYVLLENGLFKSHLYTEFEGDRSR